MDYEEWLAITGRDDSFVGCPEMDIPGTHDDFVSYKADERKCECCGAFFGLDINCVCDKEAAVA